MYSTDAYSVYNGLLQEAERTRRIDCSRRKAPKLSVYCSVGVYQLIEAGRRGGSSTKYV